MKEARYIQVAKELEALIHQEEYKAGDKIPPERELADRFGVSRMTARQAVQYLVDEELVYRERGSGTYVKSPSFQQNNVKSFTETLMNRGVTPATRIIEFGTVHSMEGIALSMGLSKETSFYKVKRLRLGNDIPMAVEVLYIPMLYCPDLNEKDLTGSFYSLLEQDYGINIKKVSYKIEAMVSNPMYNTLFELSKPAALLKVSGVSYDQKERKFLYEESLYRSDLYHYQVDIHRKF